MISQWAERKLKSVDKEAKIGEIEAPPLQAAYPQWLRDLSENAQSQILKSVPVAKMYGQIDRFYSTGKQSYWVLAANPFTRHSVEGKWQKETAYGIWRHTLDVDQRIETEYKFNFEISLGSVKHVMCYQNETYEAMVVRLADDITWVIENLQDANQARMIRTGDERRDLLDMVAAQPGPKWPADFLQAIARKDISELYNYFIKDCVQNTRGLFEKAGKDALFQRIALREGNVTEAKVALSDEAFQTLNRVKAFLFAKIFSDGRTENRNQVLKTILEFVAELLYGGENISLPEITEKMIKQRSMKYPTFEANEVIKAANSDPYFRIQIVVNIMSEMSDMEIFKIVGIGEI
ncbi:Deoxyguanosinetriphosphate triphosphohydrolase-like protein [subsurface metagenome]